MKYSLAILLSRQVLAFVVALCLQLLGKWLAPDSVKALEPHLVAILGIVASAVLGVDILAYQQSKK